MRHLYLTILLISSTPLIGRDAPAGGFTGKLKDIGQNVKEASSIAATNIKEAAQKTWNSLGKALNKSKFALENALSAHTSKDPQKAAKLAQEAAQ